MSDDNKVVPIRPDVQINYNAPVRAYGETDIGFSYEFAMREVFEEMSNIKLPSLAEIMSEPLGEGKIAFDVETNVLSDDTWMPAFVVGVDPRQREDVVAIHRVLSKPRVKPLLVSDVHIGRRRPSGKLSMTLAAALATLGSTMVLAEPLPLDPFANREERRKKKNQVGNSALQVIKAAHGPVKRGDKNATNLVKDVKPSGLLKGLIKKTEK